ncbi:DinB family protein [Paraflavitalea pollutisoli]|uniref:DinB family protein n=1 Tax=Paraflavitalea pollutisoli TaxID=3034143 RepID=UPI0023EC4CA0|nr:DinB family protein [Paraflavitalea sp. H1-2-19X]
MTSSHPLPEVWLRGPLEGVPALLQPAAHALLQAREEIHQLMQGFPETLLWEQPAGVASPAFHLQHMAGVLDRLFTYADSQLLSPQQLEYLAAEGKRAEGISLLQLLAQFDKAIERAVARISHTDPATLTEPRGVGRKQVPSTVLGLLFHAAEHTMRHTGQLLVTVQVLRAGNGV